jgi:hypothetical protein
MQDYRVIAIPTAVADEVRASRKAPRYGHPAFTETASGHGPCRHCLRTFDIGLDRRMLFTYDPFVEVGPMPFPGPIFIHADSCARFPEDAGYPQDMLVHAALLSGISRDQRVLVRLRIDGEGHDAAIEQMLASRDVAYIEVRDALAGCYDFRIERASEDAASLN